MSTTARDAYEATSRNRQKGSRLGVSDALEQLSGFGMPKIDPELQAAFLSGTQQQLPNQPVNTGPASPSIAFKRYTDPTKPELDTAKRGDLQKTGRAAALGSALGTLGMNFMNLGYNPPALEPLSSPILAQVDEMDDNYLKAMEKYQNDLRGTEMANVGIANQEMLERHKADIAAENTEYNRKQSEAAIQRDEKWREQDFQFKKDQFKNNNEQWQAEQKQRWAAITGAGKGNEPVDEYAWEGLQSWVSDTRDEITKLRKSGDIDAAELLEAQLKSYNNPDVLKTPEVRVKMGNLGKVSALKRNTEAFIQNNKLNPQIPGDFEKIVKETSRLAQKIYGKDALSEDIIRADMKRVFGVSNAKVPGQEQFFPGSSPAPTRKPKTEENIPRPSTDSTPKPTQSTMPSTSTGKRGPNVDAAVQRREKMMQDVEPRAREAQRQNAFKSIESLNKSLLTGGKLNDGTILTPIDIQGLSAEDASMVAIQKINELLAKSLPSSYKTSLQTAKERLTEYLETALLAQERQ